MKSSTMTVRSRLMLAFGILIALLLLVAGLAWRALQHESDAFEGFVSGINARAAVASELRTAVDTRAIAARNLVLVTQPRDMELERGRVTQAHETATRQLARLQDMARAPDVSAKARELIAAIARVESQYGPVALAIVQLALQQQHEEAIRRMNEECRPLLAALVQATQAYAAYTAQRSDEVLAQSDARVERERNTFVLVVVLALASGLGSGVLIVRSLTRALGAEPADLSESASRVATGDLRPLEGGGRAPAGSVLASLVAMQGNLVGIVRQVRDVSDSIATGSAQIATGNAHLSQRTEEQASALEQTAATMDQLGTTVRYNADHAQSASQLAQDANGVATRGGAVMDDVIATMKDIEASSRRIVDIIGTIEGIAFQTNILALNAAVESARAGEQGRGFAVVAGEVRTLAQRSAVAAKEIKILIDTSVAQVQRGASLVDHAGGTMQEVAGAIQRVSTIVDEISVACRQQSTGVGQVGEAVSQMDQATQQNAALVEQSAAAAESLRTQAQRLVSAVGVFSLDAGAAT